MAYTPSTALQAVEALYIGYFGRAGEPGGVAYWVAQINAAPNLQTGFARAAAAFAVQAEAKAQHPFLANPTLVSPADFVESLYQQLFGRASDAAGKAYWVAQLQAANGNPFAYGLLVAQFISGAQNDTNGNDLDVIKNKVTAAEYFTTKLAAAGIQGTDDKGQVTVAVDAAATDIIGAVTKDAASVTAANSKTDSFVAGGGGEGLTFTLSVNADGPGAIAPQVNTTGTAKADVYNGVITSEGAGSTLQSADNIDGKGGNDTLNIRVIIGGGAVAPTLTSIETVSTKIDSATLQEINLVSATGVTTVVNAGSVASSTLTYSNVAAGVTSSLSGAAGGSNTIVSYAGAAARTGTADAFNLITNGSGAATNSTLFSLNGDTSFEIANITATGKGSNISFSGAPVSVVKVSGNAAGATPTDFALSLSGSLSNVKSVDATGLTAAGLRIELGGNAQDVTVIGSAFNDTIRMGGGLTTADKIDGGAGTNTIGINNGGSLVSGLQVTNFQTLDIGGAFVSSTYDMSKLPGITALQVSSSMNQGVGAQIETINNLAKGAVININALLGFPGDGDGLVINVKDAGAGSPNDSIVVNISSPTTVVTFGSFTINDIETVTLNATSTGTGVTHTLTNLIDSAASTVNVNASTAGLNIDSLADAALVLFDASASAKAVSLTTGANAFTAAGGVAFNLGAEADNLNLTGVTYASPTKGAVVTGNGGGDTVTLELPGYVDTIVIKAATDSQVGLTTGGASKFDTVNTFDAVGLDKINVSAFGFSGTQATSFDKVPVNPIGPNGEVNAADASNFFRDAGIARGVAEVAAGANTWVYIDVNKDGNWDSGDSAVLLTAVAPALLTNANYVFV